MNVKSIVLAVLAVSASPIVQADQDDAAQGVMNMMKMMQQKSGGGGNSESKAFMDAFGKVLDGTGGGKGGNASPQRNGGDDGGGRQGKGQRNGQQFGNDDDGGGRRLADDGRGAGRQRKAAAHADEGTGQRRGRGGRQQNE